MNIVIAIVTVIINKKVNNNKLKSFAFVVYPQVVKYDKTGHYNVHHDAQPIASHSHLKCCHQNVTKTPACRLCRSADIQYNLICLLFVS